jgi:hypothetical protein
MLLKFYNNSKAPSALLSSSNALLIRLIVYYSISLELLLKFLKVYYQWYLLFLSKKLYWLFWIGITNYLTLATSSSISLLLPVTCFRLGPKKMRNFLRISVTYIKPSKISIQCLISSWIAGMVKCHLSTPCSSSIYDLVLKKRSLHSVNILCPYNIVYLVLSNYLS